ncbi:MAG TPA: hypothetical protein VMV92_01185 [Streptosporangiaceae bacterium]|nr:hypothetical protein [Streptosporangiaceae bacterium]
MKGSKVWLDCHVASVIPEQLSLPPVPGQPPLSLSSAQNDNSARCVAAAQCSIVVASAVVKISGGPKSSKPRAKRWPTRQRGHRLRQPGQARRPCQEPAAGAPARHGRQRPSAILLRQR